MEVETEVEMVITEVRHCFLQVRKITKDHF